MSLELDKPLQTKAGRKVYWAHYVAGPGILHPDTQIVAGVEIEGVVYGVDYDDNGKQLYQNEHIGDLINTPEYEYQNLYGSNIRGSWCSLESAKINALPAVAGRLKRPVGSTDVTEWEIESV